MGDIHFNILFNYAVKVVLGHFFDIFKGAFKIHNRGKSKPTFSNIHSSYFPCEIIDILKKIFVYLCESLKTACFLIIQNAIFKQLNSLFLA